MTTATIYTREQAKASDRELARLTHELSKADRALQAVYDRLHTAVNDKYEYWGRSRGWKMSHQETIAMAVTKAKGPFVSAAQQAQEALDRVAAAEETYQQAQAALARQDSEWYEHGRWERYVAVPGGHIHNHAGCFTLRPDTILFWLPELSAEPVADAVAEYGPALCSHCYPDAPSDWKQREKLTALRPDGSPMTKAEQAEARAIKEAEQVAKQAAKNANQVVDPCTGEVIYKTDRAATNAISSAMNSLLWYRSDHPSAPEWEGVIAQAVAALAAKQGCDPQQVRAEYQAKADKKFATEVRKAYQEMTSPGYRFAQFVDMSDTSNWNPAVARYAEENGLPPFDKKEQK